jgi:hypothetical protein
MWVAGKGSQGWSRGVALGSQADGGKLRLIRIRGRAMRKRMLLLVLASLAFPLAAGAQAKKAPENKVEYEKKTVINFDDDTIQGDLTRPDGEYVEARKRVAHSNLIKIREDWRDKVMQAAGDL